MRDNSQRARLAIIFIMVIMGLDVLMIGSSLLQIDLLYDLDQGIDVSDSTISANDFRESVIAILYLIAFTASAAFYIQWFRRAYWNLHTQTKNLEYTEGWAAGAWFVPFVNLVRPYKIMKELYQETDRIITERGGFVKANNQYTIISTWWIFWIIENIISNISSRLALRAESIEELLTGTYAEIFSSLIGLPLGLVAIRVIQNYAAKEQQLLATSHNESSRRLDLSGDETVLDAFI